MTYTFNTLPDEYQSNVVKEYYERSLYASISKLANGRFLVINHVVGNPIPAKTWDEAKSIRSEVAQRYWDMDKVFMGGRAAYSLLKARNAIV